MASTGRVGGGGVLCLEPVALLVGGWAWGGLSGPVVLPRLVVGVSAAPAFVSGVVAPRPAEPRRRRLSPSVAAQLLRPRNPSPLSYFLLFVACRIRAAGSRNGRDFLKKC